MNEAVLALGSNLGDRFNNLNLAIAALKRTPMVEVAQVSEIYETLPVEVLDKQPNFLNCCVKIKTELTPSALLGVALGIESSLKRERPFWHASRIIDIDLLLYEGVSCNSSELILPHPRMLERAFVLVPLKDLYPDFNALGVNFKSSYYANLSDDIIKFEI